MEKRYAVYSLHAEEVSEFREILETLILRRIRTHGEDGMVVWMRRLYQMRVRPIWYRLERAYRMKEETVSFSQADYELIRKIVDWVRVYPLQTLQDQQEEKAG